MDVLQVAEHIAGRSHILVDVVEVADEQLSPAIEVVERLVAGVGRVGDALEGLEQEADKPDGVADGKGRVLAEEVADGDIGRTPDGFAGNTGKGIVEEKRCALVGEDDGDAVELGAIATDDVGGYMFEKSLHLTSSI